jgi:regulator of cell morphogenesis and NO signaling
MKITEALRRDHQVFRGQFEDLEKAAQAGSAWSEIEERLDALYTPLDSHVQWEDELLFGALEPNLGPDSSLAAMRKEHAEIENTFSLLEKCGNFGATEGYMSHLLEVARSHFAKEEQMLFPMAEQALDTDTLERLGGEFANRRRVMMI